MVAPYLTVHLLLGRLTALLPDQLGALGQPGRAAAATEAVNTAYEGACRRMSA